MTFLQIDSNFGGDAFPSLSQILPITNQDDFSMACKSFMPSNSNRLLTSPYTPPNSIGENK